MAITQEDFKEWKQHPMTQEFFNCLKDYQASLARSSTLKATADLTLMATAEKEGQVNLINSIVEVDFIS